MAEAVGAQADCYLQSVYEHFGLHKRGPKHFSSIRRCRTQAPSGVSERVEACRENQGGGRSILAIARSSGALKSPLLRTVGSSLDSDDDIVKALHDVPFGRTKTRN